MSVIDLDQLTTRQVALASFATRIFFSVGHIVVVSNVDVLDSLCTSE
jgi:hypothetical protein